MKSFSPGRILVCRALNSVSTRLEFHFLSDRMCGLEVAADCRKADHSKHTNPLGMPSRVGGSPSITLGVPHEERFRFHSYHQPRIPGLG